LDKDHTTELARLLPCPKAFSTAMAKAAANLEIFALVLQGVLKNKEEGRRSRKARQKAKKKRPSAQPVPESQEEAMSWKARLRCWKRMAIKAWPKGDRKALCHRFSNARSGFKELEAERHWGEVAQVIQSTV